MKSVGKFIAAALLATSLLPFNAFGGGLLGGVLNGNGNNGGVVSNLVNDVAGDGGVVDNLLGGGGTGNVVNDLVGQGGVVDNVVNDVAGEGGVVDELLGNGGVVDNLVDNVSVDVNLLPDINIGGGGGGGNGGNGNGGGSGGNGGNGGNGGAGGNGGGNGGGGNGNGGGGDIVIKYYSNGGSGGGGFAIPSGISSRLKTLLRILAERDYLRVSNGRAVCLNSFGVAQVAGWVPQKDWGALQNALSNYSQDIYTLRQLLANCRSSTQRQALNLTDLNRVIAIDIGKDGQPVLYML